MCWHARTCASCCAATGADECQPAFAQMHHPPAPRGRPLCSERRSCPWLQHSPLVKEGRGKGAEAGARGRVMCSREVQPAPQQLAAQPSQSLSTTAAATLSRFSRHQRRRQRSSGTRALLSACCCKAHITAHKPPRSSGRCSMRVHAPPGTCGQPPCLCVGSAQPVQATVPSACHPE